MYQTRDLTRPGQRPGEFYSEHALFVIFWGVHGLTVCFQINCHMLIIPTMMMIVFLARQHSCVTAVPGRSVLNPPWIHHLMQGVLVLH